MQKKPAHVLLNGSCAPLEALRLYVHLIEDFEEGLAAQKTDKKEERYTVRPLAASCQLAYAG